MKRIAAPMIGGLATSFLLELLVYPAVYKLWKRRSLPAPAVVPASPRIGPQPLAAGSLP
jgi:Cu(I)/Ag(I) efflux system membrane protein CusA/SilA